MNVYIDKDGIRNVIIDRQAPKNQHARMCEVVAVLPNGETYGVYRSIKEASLIVGRGVGAIHRSLRTGSICKGMRWYRLEEHRELWFKHGTEWFSFTPHEERDEAGSYKTGTKRKNPLRNLSPERMAALSKIHSEHAKSMAKDPNSKFGKIKRKARPVCTVDSTRRWESAKTCAEDIGALPRSVGNAIRRNHLLYGFRLRYE